MGITMVKITMDGKSAVAGLTEKDMAALQKEVEETNAQREMKGKPADWDILSEIVYDALYRGLLDLRVKHEESQAVGAAQDSRN